MREVNIGSEDKILLWIQDNVLNAIDEKHKAALNLPPAHTEFFTSLMRDCYRNEISLIIKSSMTGGSSYI